MYFAACCRSSRGRSNGKLTGHLIGLALVVLGVRATCSQVSVRRPMPRLQPKTPDNIYCVTYSVLHTYMGHSCYDQPQFDTPMALRRVCCCWRSWPLMTEHYVHVKKERTPGMAPTKHSLSPPPRRLENPRPACQRVLEEDKRTSASTSCRVRRKRAGPSVRMARLNASVGTIVRQSARRVVRCDVCRKGQGLSSLPIALYAWSGPAQVTAPQPRESCVRRSSRASKMQQPLSAATSPRPSGRDPQEHRPAVVVASRYGTLSTGRAVVVPYTGTLKRWHHRPAAALSGWWWEPWRTTRCWRAPVAVDYAALITLGVVTCSSGRWCDDAEANFAAVGTPTCRSFP